MYTKDELMALNVYSLRHIPQDQSYETLRRFVSDERTVNLSKVVRQTVIPTYLKNRYGDITPSSHTITRGSSSSGCSHQDPNKDISRRKLYVSKNETAADKTNEEIREILSKISDGNKNKLMNEFMKKNIPDECGQTLINNIYEFAVDLSYLIHIYVEIILNLKYKNEQLYLQLLDKIVKNAYDPLIENNETIKRLRMGNIMLVAEIYKKNPVVLSHQTVIEILNYLVNRTLSSDLNRLDYLQMLCELLKSVISILKSENLAPIQVIIDQLSKITTDHNYDKRNRFMIQDIIDLYYEDEEDD
jgi:hypothetical protein